MLDFMFMDFSKCLYFGKFHKGSHDYVTEYVELAKVDYLLKWRLEFLFALFFYSIWREIFMGCSFFFSFFLMLYLLCSAQECVLWSLVLRGEVRWENSHHHWSQHWYWQRNSQGSGKKRYGSDLSVQLCLSPVSLVYFWLSHIDVPALLFIFTNL